MELSGSRHHSVGNQDGTEDRAHLVRARAQMAIHKVYPDYTLTETAPAPHFQRNDVWDLQRRSHCWHSVRINVNT